MRLSCLLLLAVIASPAAQVWTVRVEEPTGLYRRTGEVIAIPLDKVGGRSEGFTVADPAGRELPWQTANGQLLFPVSLMPGELPVYRVSCCDATQAPRFQNSIVLRRLGMRRVEFGNSVFRAIIDIGVPAFVEVYSLRAGPQRMLNLVETTPEGPGALKGDVHETSPEAATFSPPPVPGVDGPNSGWTTLGGTGPFTNVELLETGPLRGRVRLTRDGEAWDISWTANSAWFAWKAKRGFRFTSISGSPYEPFNRCVGGSEYDGPDGPGDQEPQPHDIALHDWSTLPGGHMVYYQREENYGALGIVALDGDLRWRGTGTRRVIGERSAGDTEIAVSFPAWSGAETMVEARKENRLIREPVLVHVSAASEGHVNLAAPSAREPAVDRGARAASRFRLEAISLDGEWQLAFAAKGEGPPQSGWRTVNVPGTAHTQWLKPDQIYSHAAEWVSYKEWWYKRKFRVPEKFRGKRLRLQFEATDYYADTYINGVYAGHHEGYIDPYGYDITALAPAGTDDEILVRVWTPVTYYWRHRPYTIKGAYGAVDQKPDDITATGITRSVRIVASTDAVIRDLAVDTRLDDGRAEVAVQLQAELPEGEASRYTWELTLAPRNFNSSERYQARAPAGANPSRVTIPIDHPRLWWTWDHGKPNLYTLDVRLLDASGRAVDGESLAVGIREIEKIGWDFYLNRKRMFIRGTNYYDSIYMSEMNRAKYERDMKLMLGMNVNMIRVHCHFSNREFYDLADENGVLIWQDYLEAWYPHDRGFAQRAAALYDNHIRYVRNHPSVAIWITSDEEDFENYRQITKHLAPRPFLVDPQRRPVHRSTGRFGDSHVYHGWYDGSIWEYTQMKETFVSELGATSLPNYETLVKFMGDQWPIRDHAAEWTWRRLQIPQAMKAWGDPGDMTMKEYIPQTQAYVSRLFQIALERTRERKSEGAGGILHFHAIDIWPSVTMAAIDFERTPTKVYDVVRRSFEPVAALFQYDRDRWQPGTMFTCGVWAVNDGWDAVAGASVRWRIVASAGGTLLSGSFNAPLKADSALRLGDVEWRPAEPGKYELHAEVVDAAGQRISENIYEFQVSRLPQQR
jgi:beta-mannosidase